VSELAVLDAVTEAVESGAGLPEVVRAAARALDSSLAVTDATGTAIAVAARSSAEERVLLTGGDGVLSLPLRVAETNVGALHMRVRSQPSDLVRRLLLTIIASEVERVRAPDLASESAAAEFMRHALGASGNAPLAPEELAARGRELSLDLTEGASVIVVRAHPQAPTEEGWRSRARAIAERGARAAAVRSIAAVSERDVGAGVEIVLLVPGAGHGLEGRAAEAVLRELQSGLPGFIFAVGRSRSTGELSELPRAAAEALLATNVAEGRSEDDPLAFEDTGAYRLLLSAMTESPSELESFYSETVEPLLAYDEQYETNLLQTLETFLEADGNVAGTAQRLFTHRHTIYYRLERVRELTGLDVASSDGREKLSLGLKAMRVLGIASTRGPASEDGVRGGRLPRGNRGGRDRR
jgi:DNA-binding PucR family transcriptional regulator